MTTSPWPALLDALEERTRRLADRLTDPAAGQAAEPVPEVELVPDGPLPAALAGRARWLLAETRRLEGLAAERLVQARRALTYRH